MPNALLEQAVALPEANDLPQQALAWKTLSSVRYDLGEYEPAIKLVSPHSIFTGRRMMFIGKESCLATCPPCMRRLGKTPTRLRQPERHSRTPRKERDTAGVVYCLSQLAGLYQQQGDLESALRTFYQGLAWVSEIGYAPLVEAEIQKELGNFYTQIGDSERASHALQRCIELEKGKNDPISLEARGLLAAAMQHQGKLHAAVAEDTAAIEIARSLALKQDEAGLLLKRASVELALHHPSPAQMDIKAAWSARNGSGVAAVGGRNGGRVGETRCYRSIREEGGDRVSQSIATGRKRGVNAKSNLLPWLDWRKRRERGATGRGGDFDRERP